MSTTHVTVAAVPMTVEYIAPSETHAEIVRVWPEGGLDNIHPLLAQDVINSIRVACVKHAREEAAFRRRCCEEQEAVEP